MELVKKAAGHFLSPGQEPDIQMLGNGLIHHTFLATDSSSKLSIVLQAINTQVFRNPDDIVHNYLLVYRFLNRHDKSFIPAPIISHEGHSIWLDEEQNAWRATEFIEDSFSPMTAATAEDAFTVSNIFGRFTRSLSGIEISQFREIIPAFHQLSWRYHQLEDAIVKAPLDRLLKSTHCIAEFRQRKGYVDFYESIQYNVNYPLRIMHHDAKISNILFSKTTNRVICPVDLDTVMPGRFFSDLGDMIRSMSCSLDENSLLWEEIQINPDFYQSIIRGYLEGVGDIFTTEEKRNIHWAGLIMIYMQGIRFLADFLNGDIYYKTAYQEQNLNRALNQLILLEKLEAFVKSFYGFNPG
jgi:thiamine kinase-like enzyme